MDKREEKTYNDVYEALKNLLKDHEYSKLTVADIIKEASISRSTFYAHFKSKEDVLDSVCQSIFKHVFSSSLNKEKDHDFSSSNVFDYDHYLTHIFYHFLEEQELISAILLSQGSALFMKQLKEEITPLMKSIVGQNNNRFEGMDEKMVINQLINSFSGLLTYWVENGCQNTPEMMTKSFISLNNLQ